MLDKQYTFVIIPPKTSKVVRLSLSRPVLVGLAALVLVFVAIGAVAIERSVELYAELSDYQVLKSDYLHQRVSLKKVANRVEHFQGEMERMRELDYKLRLITDLEVERPGPSMYGIGGIGDNNDQQLIKEAHANGLDLLSLLNKDLTRLEKVIRFQEESFSNLKAHLADKRDLIERTPFRWPVRGFLSSTFGPRVDPFTGSQRMHSAVDIVAPTGTPIESPADGIVTFSGVDPHMGNMLVVDHGYGVITRYGHTNAILVSEGQRVKRGDVIATVGTTGRSTGPHLHYEVLINDVSINPLKLIID